MSEKDHAALLQRHDPDRFLAAMAAPVECRKRLITIFAFNALIAQAAWSSQEMALCAIRLQWWADRLQEIQETGSSSGHPILTPLADSLDSEGAKILGDVIAARQWDVNGEPFVDADAMQAHLEKIGGSLTWAAARALGAEEGESSIRDMGRATALANWLRAVPELTALKREPLFDTSQLAVRAMAQEGLMTIKRARKIVPPIARPATRAGWHAASTLRRAAANPAAVAGGRLHSSEFSRRAALIVSVLRGSA